MNKEWKKKWIEALESGEFTQYSGRLRANHGDAYCCLGVLATVADPEGWEIWEDPSHDIHPYSHRGTCSILSTKFRKDMHITKEEQRKMSDMNDEGASFKDIAEWIRENL